MNEKCEKMLAAMSLLCKQLYGTHWTDDFEYICWAYLIGDRKLPLRQEHQEANSPTGESLRFLKASAEQINGWVNDVTYFEMERWLILYKNWKQRN